MTKPTFKDRAQAQAATLKAEEEKTHNAMLGDMIELLEEIENDLAPTAEKLTLLIESFPPNAPGVALARTLSNVIEHSFKARLEAMRQS